MIPGPSSEESLQSALSRLVPQAKLEWQGIPHTALEGFLLEFHSANLPLPAESVDQVMDTPPFWSLLWPAGRELCQLFSHHPHLLADRSAVDLGCGSGLVAVAMAQAGARVVAADSDEVSLQSSVLNGRRNGVELSISTAWTGQTDSLILADFLYDESNLEQLSSLCQVCGEILVVDSRLKSLSYPGFQHFGEREGLAFPDLDPHREFGFLNLWYWGPRASIWREALG